MAILDFLKKDSSDSSTTTPNSDASAVQTTQTTTQTVQPVVPSQPYNGIGSPPGGGQSYNGIGAPPQGQAYSGIGTPNQPVQTPSSQPVATNVTPTAPSAVTTDQASPSATSAQTPAGDKNPTPTPGATPPAEGQDKQTQLDLMTHLTQRSNRVFVEAQKKASELKVELVDSEHVLHGLLSDSEIYKIMTDDKIQPQMIEQELDKIYQKGASQTTPQPSPRVKRILENSLITARKLGYEFISPEHILLSLYEEGEGAGARILSKLGLKKDDLNKKITGKKEGLKEDAKDGDKTTGTLEQYSVDLTAKAEQGLLDPVVERSEVIERVIHILSRRTKNNPSLIGEAGVGKTAIVEGLAQKIASKQVPESLIGKRVLKLDLMSILAGASHRGEFEERMKKVIDEIVASEGKIILFIDEIHNLVGAGAGGEGSLDASNFLKPSLARGELQLIGATTITEYRRYIEKDPALERRFQPIVVPEPTIEQSIKMLKSLREKYEAFHRVKIPDAAIETAVKLSKRYVGDRYLPDKAVDLIDEAAAAVRLPLISLPEEIRSSEERLAQLKQESDESTKSGNAVKVRILKSKIDDLEVELKDKQSQYELKKGQTTSEVTPEIIKDVIARWTSIPISKITESEVEKLKKLEDIMHEELINQDNAVSSVSEAVRRGRAGLKSTNRPVGSFIFLGPTGVGKTELAKVLAGILFGQHEAMIRFDMTEYMEKHEVAKMLGAPPGYVGYEEGGTLTEAVRRKPYSVVLFDEIEKAHPDIFNILLQILDDGRLTDNKGHVISFKETVVICTSNIGTKTIQDEIMASGKIDIEEPNVLSTFAFSPRGRQIMTIMGKVFEKDGAGGKWNNKTLLDYFAGSQIIAPQKNVDNNEAKNSEPSKTKTFPGKEFHSHAMSSKGVELITVDDTMYIRTSTTAKEWTAISLIDYFKDSVVINALPDAPEEQLPTARVNTHAFTPDEREIVTLADRYWTRKESDKNWQTGTLKDYFADSTLAPASVNDGAQKNPSQNMPTDPNKTGLPKDSGSTKPGLPINYWDIHTIAPDSSEYIVVGDDIYTRKQGAKIWAKQDLKTFFGADFPIENELEEKQKVESELDKNKYERTKAKVMGQLRDFMRPELINRFDEVIIFEPLKYIHMISIVELNLKALTHLMEDQDMGFSWTEVAAKEIVRQGFDPIYGARPLRRTIQKLIENPISSLIIEHKVEAGSAVHVDFDGENFVFNIEHVELVPESSLKDKKIRKFMCVDSHHMFDTEVPENATIICPINAGEPVKEVIEDEKETATDNSKATIETPDKFNSSVEPNKIATLKTEPNLNQASSAPQSTPEMKNLQDRLTTASNGNGHQTRPVVGLGSAS